MSKKYNLAYHNSNTGKLSSSCCCPCPSSCRQKDLIPYFWHKKIFCDITKDILDIRYFWIFGFYWILDFLLDMNGY
jgi:hypothetical protein